jgi:hypothetical protein
MNFIMDCCLVKDSYAGGLLERHNLLQLRLYIRLTNVFYITVMKIAFLSFTISLHVRHSDYCMSDELYDKLLRLQRHQTRLSNDRVYVHSQNFSS